MKSTKQQQTRRKSVSGKTNRRRKGTQRKNRAVRISNEDKKMIIGFGLLLTVLLLGRVIDPGLALPVLERLLVLLHHGTH